MRNLRRLVTALSCCVFSVIHMGMVDCGYSATLSEDSARFAVYWELAESGQTDSARSYLLGLGSAEGGRLAQMANYLLAYQAHESGDYASVPTLLSFGIPEILSDHAAMLRARSLVDAGQPQFATGYLSLVASDSESVSRVAAGIELAQAFRAAGRLDSALKVMSAESAARKTDDEARSLRILEAEIRAELDEHHLAADLYWETYSKWPSSMEGKSAKRALESYLSIHGVRPREQNDTELAAELSAYEQLSQFERGLNRVREVTAPGASVSRRELADFYRARYAAGLKRYKEALRAFKEFLAAHPTSRFRARALYQLGRAAYLADEDSVSIGAFEELVRTCDDSTTICEGLSLLGALHLDRHRARDAVSAFTRWTDFANSSNSRADAWWKLGWSQWESGEYARAADSWNELSRLVQDGEYGPASLYWTSRAKVKVGEVAEAETILKKLRSRYPYSYYTVLLYGNSPGDVVEEDLSPPSLDSLWESGGAHSQKFALLTAMRLVDDALDESAASSTEQGNPRAWPWWDAQLQIWKGDRMAAWRITRRQLGDFIRSAGDRPAAFSQVVYPLDYDPTIVKQSRARSLDPYFVCGLICQESHYAESIVSSAGAIGLMQLMPGTARTQARKLGLAYSTDRLYEADYNLTIGIAHVEELWKEFSGDSLLVLAAYNAGKSAAQMWFEEFGDVDRDVFVEKIPYRETRLFIKRIIEHTAAYRRLYPELLNADSGDSFPSPK